MDNSLKHWPSVQKQWRRQTQCARLLGKGLIRLLIESPHANLWCNHIRNMCRVLLATFQGYCSVGKDFQKCLKEQPEQSKSWSTFCTKRGYNICWALLNCPWFRKSGVSMFNGLSIVTNHNGYAQPPGYVAVCLLIPVAEGELLGEKYAFFSCLCASQKQSDRHL